MVINSIKYNYTIEVSNHAGKSVMMWMQACKVVVNITIIILEGGFLKW